LKDKESSLAKIDKNPKLRLVTQDEAENKFEEASPESFKAVKASEAEKAKAAAAAKEKELSYSAKLKSKPKRPGRRPPTSRGRSTKTTTESKSIDDDLK
ncbi:MAG: hypothetical protein AAFO07_31100, partial [Bacteroidota bacterium]